MLILKETSAISNSEDYIIYIKTLFVEDLRDKKKGQVLEETDYYRDYLIKENSKVYESFEKIVDPKDLILVRENDCFIKNIHKVIEVQNEYFKLVFILDLVNMTMIYSRNNQLYLLDNRSSIWKELTEENINNSTLYFDKALQLYQKQIREPAKTRIQINKKEYWNLCKEKVTKAHGIHCTKIGFRNIKDIKCLQEDDISIDFLDSVLDIFKKKYDYLYNSIHTTVKEIDESQEHIVVVYKHLDKLISINVEEHITLYIVEDGIDEYDTEDGRELVPKCILKLKKYNSKKFRMNVIKTVELPNILSVFYIIHNILHGKTRISPVIKKSTVQLNLLKMLLECKDD